MRCRARMKRTANALLRSGADIRALGLARPPPAPRTGTPRSGIVAPAARVVGIQLYGRPDCYDRTDARAHWRASSARRERGHTAIDIGISIAMGKGPSIVTAVVSIARPGPAPLLRCAGPLRGALASTSTFYCVVCTGLGNVGSGVGSDRNLTTRTL